MAPLLPICPEEQRTQGGRQPGGCFWSLGPWLGGGGCGIGPGIAWDWVPSEGKALGVPGSNGVEGKAGNTVSSYTCLCLKPRSKTNTSKAVRAESARSEAGGRGGAAPLSSPVFCAFFHLLCFPPSDRPLKLPWGLRGEQGAATGGGGD